MQATAVSLLPQIALEASHKPWTRVREAVNAFPLKLELAAAASDGARPETAVLVDEDPRPAAPLQQNARQTLAGGTDTAGGSARSQVLSTEKAQARACTTPEKPSPAAPSAPGSSRKTAIEIDDDDDDDDGGGDDCRAAAAC